MTKSHSGISFEAAIDRWLVRLRAERKSPATIEQYRYHLMRLQAWLGERGIDRPDAIKRRKLETWLAEINGRWAASTVRQSVSATRSFVYWLRSEHIIKKKRKERLLKALKSPAPGKHIQRTLSIAEIDRLRSACDPGTEKGIRDLAMIALLIDSGLRAREIRHILATEVEFGIQIGPGVVVNRVLAEIKGGRRSYGYFGSYTATYLRRWLEVRELVARPGVAELFVSVGGLTPGRGLSRHGLKVIVRKLGIKAGVAGVSPHAFRRSFACLLELAGASTRMTQLLGRWERVEMVVLYTRELEAALRYNQFAPMDYIERTLNER